MSNVNSIKITKWGYVSIQLWFSLKKNFKCEIWNFSIDGQIVTILEVPFAVVMLAVRQLQVAFAVSTLDNYCN